MESDTKQKLIKNLKDAFTGETTASAKYEAYCKKAKEEGYELIAKLFEAASKSESIHARNHKKVIEKLGEKVPDVKPEYTVKTTRENILNAIEGEAYEITTMYPEFIKLAESLGEYGAGATQTFIYAMETEVKHKQYYEEALKTLDAKTADKLYSNYWICPICGNTVTDEKDILKCEICENEKVKWTKI